MLKDQIQTYREVALKRIVGKKIKAIGNEPFSPRPGALLSTKTIIYFTDGTKTSIYNKD